MKKITTAICLAMLVTTSLYAQTGYKMQPIQIQTQWAKEVSPLNVLKEYPRPQMVRKQWQNLNGLWSYAITPIRTELPTKFDGKILVPYPLESALSGVKKSLQPDQNLWYRRSFMKPVLKPGERALLHFGAVDWQATVFVNGKKLGEHSGGYTDFTYDVTAALKPANNSIIVKVFDPTEQGNGPHGKQVLNPSGIMYTASSGIWQTVWLETVPAVSVESLKITPDIDKGNLTLEVNTKGKNEGAEIRAIVSSNGTKIAVWHTMHNPASDGPDRGVISINNAANLHLWSPDDPFLYDLDLQVVKNGKVIDEVKSYFGMRKIEVKKDDKGNERIFLNNKYTYNLGTLDQGFWPDGLYTAPTDAALKFDIEASKAMGFNTIRKHIKVEPARWYYWTDKLGMLVWQDMVNPGGSGAEFEKESLETVTQLYNHPSITTWVVFNEGWGAFDQGRITQMIKDADPSRIVNGHTGENLFGASPKDVSKKWANSDMTDIHAYPPPGIPPRLPGKARVLGEFGGIGVAVEGHVWDDFAAGWGYGKTVDPKTMSAQYAVMVDTLKALEARGLSGSIYTQPFDVETEQNGLITYDRKITKMPLTAIRAINSKLWPVTANFQIASKDFKPETAPQNVKDYFARLEDYKTGKKESNFLYYLAIMASANKDKEYASKVADDYISQLKDPFTPANLKFIKRFTQSVNSKGFEILYHNINKVDRILGKDEAEATLTAAIEADEIISHLPKNKSTKPDWAAMVKNVAKYGELGKETLLQYQVIYGLNNNDLPIFKAVYLTWLNNYGCKRKWISEGLLNNWSWTIFEHSSDTEMLTAAMNLSACSLTKGSDPNNIDTYANILYKLGRKEEAIKWEQKAAQIDPYKQEFKDALEKFQTGK